MTDSEIEARLRGVEVSIATMNELLKADLAHLSALTAKHDLILEGNPLDPKEESVGLKIKVDRLEGSEKVRRWILRTIASGVFVLLGTAISHFLGL